MATARMLDKGLLVIPKEIRARLNLKRGDRLELEVENDHIIARPKSNDLTVEYKGCFEGGKLSFAEMEEIYGRS